ncbi:hypothetical protein [Paenibacillus sp. Soil766]|uniref:hypothetical protein n=1 Tax=Paenibacillus sp. Soil766 TaxID=1736404 RepID=UPI0012FBF767|nr:hypothetical protein [Paenibacillus sp. Soil766]
MVRHTQSLLGSKTAEWPTFCCLQPRSTIEITFDASIIHHSNVRRLTLWVAATYQYQVNEPVHTGTVLSNVVVIRIDHSEEYPERRGSRFRGL